MLSIYTLLFKMMKHELARGWVVLTLQYLEELDQIRSVSGEKGIKFFPIIRPQRSYRLSLILISTEPQRDTNILITRRINSTKAGSFVRINPIPLFSPA